jgi:hypothetical protein
VRSNLTVLDLDIWHSEYISLYLLAFQLFNSSQLSLAQRMGLPA